MLNSIKLAANEVERFFLSDGYTQTNMGYLKHNNDFIFVININESAGKGKFALELGVNPSHCTIFPGNDSNSRFVLKASIHEVFATVFRKFF